MGGDRSNFFCFSYLCEMQGREADAPLLPLRQDFLAKFITSSISSVAVAGASLPSVYQILGKSRVMGKLCLMEPSSDRIHQGFAQRVRDHGLQSSDMPVQGRASWNYYCTLCGRFLPSSGERRMCASRAKAERADLCLSGWWSRSRRHSGIETYPMQDYLVHGL